MPVLEQLLEQYPGKVKVVFKHFPLRSHKFAIKAAQATVAAQQQGKFWPFHDLLFKQYNKINDQKIEEISKSLGLDPAKYQNAFKASSTMARISDDLSHGRNAGVRGTPSVFINGRLLRDKSIEGFKREITKALKR